LSSIVNPGVAGVRDTFIVIANAYDDEADALADYEAVRKLYAEHGMIDTYDAAVVTKNGDGEVKVVPKHGEPFARELSAVPCSDWRSARWLRSFRRSLSELRFSVVGRSAPSPVPLPVTSRAAFRMPT
jgi:hypothetical protein